MRSDGHRTPARLPGATRLVRLASAGLLVVLAVTAFAGLRSGTPTELVPVAQTEHTSMAAGMDMGVRTNILPTITGPTEQTKWGPLTAGDRNVLIRVHLANLWEEPTAESALTKSQNPRVQAAARVMMTDHTRLKGIVVSLAKQLGVELPDQPNALQQGWMRELKPLSGAKFDETFVNRLRAAHGTVFGLIAEDRGATENSLIRGFDQTAVDIVMRHMTMLEATGEVAPSEIQSLRASPIHGPFSLPIIVGAAALILIANLVLARRRSWN
jgi:predicted outer membrane protein